MTMDDKIKQILGEQGFIIAVLQVQLEAVKAECEQLKKLIAEQAQGRMFVEAVRPPPKTNGEARPDV
jgi:hypothetical protein